MRDGQNIVEQNVRPVNDKPLIGGAGRAILKTKKKNGNPVYHYPYPFTQKQSGSELHTEPSAKYCRQPE